MGFDRKRNSLIAVIIAVIFLTSVYAYGASRQSGSGDSEEKSGGNYGGVIRFHVVANSNSERDQALKLEVRDRVLAVVNQALVSETMLRHEEEDGLTARLDLEEAHDLIEENLDKIEAVAEEVIAENGSNYEAVAELGVRWIPQKTYGDVTFPAGNYEALNITIGEGQGENWWCVLFPPLCIIDPEGSSLDGIETDSFGENSEAITLKFKTQELYEELF